MSYNRKKEKEIEAAVCSSFWFLVKLTSNVILGFIERGIEDQTSDAIQEIL